MLVFSSVQDVASLLGEDRVPGMFLTHCVGSQPQVLSAIDLVLPSVIPCSVQNDSDQLYRSAEKPSQRFL